MGQVLGHLEPKIVWDIFEEITKIPRPSKKEEKIAAWVIQFAKDNGLEYNLDKLGNIVVRRVATLDLYYFSSKHFNLIEI